MDDGAKMIAEAVSAFAVQGIFVDAEAYGSGHINDTFLVSCQEGASRKRYILQRINTRIFRDVSGLMTNVARVTEHAADRLAVAGASDPKRRTLTVIRTHSGGYFHKDTQGNCWRCYLFIEGARTYDIVASAAQAYQAARAFGEFQKLAASLPGERLAESIPRFHDTRARFERLREAAEANPAGRFRTAGAEWDFIRSREREVDTLLALHAKGEIPERITHNDTKLNNVMIDDATGEGICVIDLDTVMPGLALYDFGDMVRTATSPTAEDETDLSRVSMRMPMFEALARGYWSGAGSFLNDAEKSHLSLAAKLITLEIGIRFLTDHLEGDVYFKIHRPGHNLDRCRTQLALVRSIEAQEEAMMSFVDSL